MYCIEVEYSEDKDRFLGFPKKLYEKEFLTQDWKTEMQILNNCHTLKKFGFEVYSLLQKYKKKL